MLGRRLRRLLGFLIISIAIIALAVTAVNTVEIQSDVSFIIILPAGNPYQSLYDEMLYPTVRIESESGIGSGVVINLDADKRRLTQTYILTANHVIENQKSVSVTFYTYTNTIISKTTITAFVVITDSNKDLALLTIHNSSLITHNYTARLALKNYVPYLFTPIYAVGCSLGLDPRPSFGHLCALGELCGEWEISAPILPGNSGGPVFDANTHELIGIAVWVKICRGQLVTTMAGIVPISEIYSFLDNINHKVHKEH